MIPSRCTTPARWWTGPSSTAPTAAARPATFPLGRLIRAWQLAVPQMGVGDTIEIAVPSDLGYGPQGGGPIPGGATLLFKIELLGIVGQ